MPTSVVKSLKDERLWAKAKGIASDEGHAGEWDYIMGIFQRMKGQSKEACIMKDLSALLVDFKKDAPILKTASKDTNAQYLVTLLLEHGDTLKEAGVLDSAARISPTWLRPLIQKLIVKMKYPELYSLMRQSSKFKRLKADKYKDIAKALGGRNEDLFRRALDVEAKLYGGKGTADLLRRQVPYTSPFTGL